jgi:hypothetical protein
MKINELTGIKNIKIKDKFELKNYLIGLGFQYLNNGGFSYTFKGKNAVLKIFEDDKGYEQYIKFIKNVPNNFIKFIPKVSSVKTLPYNPNIKFIKLEFLTETEDTKYDDIAYYTSLFLNYIPKNINNFEGINTKQKIKNIFEKINDHDLIKFSDDYNKYIDFSLFEFLFYLKQKTHKKIDLDLGPNNIMMRGNQFVVTDPWALK